MIPTCTPERAHAGDHIERPCTETQATDVEAMLAQRLGVMVRPVLDGRTVHLWPERRLTTAEEVRVLRAFAAVTDSPLAWHGDVVWTATRCDPCGQYVCCCLGGAR